MMCRAMCRTMCRITCCVSGRSSALPRRRSPAFRGDSGFSLVEVLVISILVALVLLSLVPLFSRSMVANMEGWMATEGVSHGRSELEDKSAVLLDRPAVTVPPAALEVQEERVFQPTSRDWLDPTDPEAPDLVFWERSTRVRLFSLSDLTGPASEEKRFDTPLPGDIDPRFVHFREVNVWVQHQRGADVAEQPEAGKGLDVTVLRSY